MTTMSVRLRLASVALLAACTATSTTGPTNDYTFADQPTVSYVSSPLPGATVPSGIVTVTGVGHGFEASLSVSAFLAGDPDTLFDTVVTQAGSMEEPGRFVVELDLSDAEPGAVVAIVVRGGVGLETDPGETGAVAVVIG